MIETPQGPKGDGLKTGELVRCPEDRAVCVLSGRKQAELEREKINKPAWTAEAPELEFPADLPEIDNIAVHDWFGIRIEGCNCYLLGSGQDPR